MPVEPTDFDAPLQIPEMDHPCGVVDLGVDRSDHVNSIRSECQIAHDPRLLERLQLAARVKVPEPHCVVPGTGTRQCAAAIRREGDRPDPPGMALKPMNLTAAGDVPEPGRHVPATCQRPSAVG